MIRCIALGLCGMAGFAATVWIAPHLPLAHGLPPKPIAFPVIDRPGLEYFVLRGGGEETSQMALYHDIGRSIGHAREADILFLGNSRLPLGLRGEFIVPRAESLGLKVFSLACSSEQFRFDLELIRKHDLRPKVVVVVGGPEFYRDGLSPAAEKTFEMTRWEAFRSFLEVQGKWEFTSRLHSRLTRQDLTGQVKRSLYIEYRSARTGFWAIRQEPEFLHAARKGKELDSYAHLVPAAQEIHDEVSKRDGLMVLTMVPFTRYASGHLPLLAATLQVPLILPELKGLQTADIHHLTRESAERFSNAFWNQFIADPQVRHQLGLAPKRPVSEGPVSKDLE